MNPGRLVFPALRWKADSGFAHEAEAIDRALAFGAGGFLVFGGTVDSVAALTERLRRQSSHPLLIGADLERGAGQQVQGLGELPPPAALASLDDPEAVEAAGARTGRDARSVGIDWVFAPVADLDQEPDNPIVQTRSFGADPEQVGALVARWIRGCQGAGALACAKHFPGHGRTRHDSHDRLPTVHTGVDRLRSTDLVPFRAAIGAGVASMMTAHVAFPALDPSGVAATCSAPILGLLREELGFRGLVVTDALMMAGAHQSLTPEAAALAALRAGVDALLYPPDPAAACDAIAAAARQDAEVARAVERALDRVAGALARVRDADPGAAAPADGAALAARLVRQGFPGELRLRPPLHLTVVDDDVDGAYPAGPSDWVERRLLERGAALGTGGSRVVLAFAEPRASKGRAGFGPASRRALALAAPGADLVVVFAHPRAAAAAAAGGGAPIAVAWHRQRLMQETVADWLADRLA